MRDVVVSGMGALTGVGNDLETTWQGSLAARSGAGPLTRFDVSEYPIRSRIACEVDGDVADHDLVDGRNMGHFARLAVVAAAEAIKDADLDPETDAWNPDRVGVAVATGAGGTPEFEEGAAELTAEKRPSPRFAVRYLPGLAAGHVSIAFDAQGPNRAPTTACAAGAHAIGHAVDDIRLDRADVMLAGGTESALSPTCVAGFDALRALSTRNDAPEAASRPFDADRDGFVLGEGAGVLVLEAREHAERRGVEAPVEVAGVGVTSDAFHSTRPRDDARGLSRAMEHALDDARVKPGAVDLVSAHATSTPRGDPHEADAIRAVFGADPPPVAAPKSSIGHTLGAAGAVEAALAIRSIETGAIPPVVTYETPDEDCDVPVVTERMDRDVRVALSNSAGFGGSNASLLLRASER